MAGTFPVLSSGCAVMLPFTKRRRIATGGVQFTDRSMQVYADAPQINAWETRYAGLRYADLAALRDFFDLQKGSFDKSWVFALDATNYASCTFVDDVFDYTEDETLSFSVALRFRQVIGSGLPGAWTASFPALKPGVVTQLPFGTRHFYETVSVEMPSGQKYASSTVTNPVRSWSLGFPVVTRAEASLLLAFFAGAWGRLKTFSWTDPITGEAFPRVRFGMDEIALEHRTPKTVSTTLILEEMP